VDALGSVVFDELWRGVVWVDLDLVDSRDDLKKEVSKSYVDFGGRNILCMMGH
jgi:hypothetical protein